MNFHGISSVPFEHIFVHPWVSEAQDILETSNVLNIYGPFRHGKTSLAEILSGRWDTDIQERTAFIHYTNLPFDDLSAFVAGFVCYGKRIQNQESSEEECKREIKDFSPADHAEMVLEALDQYRRNMATGEKRSLRISLDEMQVLFRESPDFCQFFTFLVDGIRARPDIQLTVNTLYPLSAYYQEDRIETLVPEVRVRKWGRAAIVKYFDYLIEAKKKLWRNHEVANAPFLSRSNDSRNQINRDNHLDRLWENCGGTPYVLAHLIDHNDTSILSFLRDEKIEEIERVQHYHFDTAVRCEMYRTLLNPEITERVRAVEIFKEVSRGIIFAPQSPLDQAAAMHLCIAGCVEETMEGHLVSAGKFFDAEATRKSENVVHYFLRSLEDVLAASSNLPKKRLEPLMARRSKDNPRTRVMLHNAPLKKTL